MDIDVMTQSAAELDSESKEMMSYYLKNKALLKAGMQRGINQVPPFLCGVMNHCLGSGRDPGVTLL